VRDQWSLVIEATNDTSGFLALLDNASSGALERGLDLAGRGRVSLGSVSDGVVQARVQGTVVYRVALTAGDNGSWSCDCAAQQMAHSANTALP